MHVLVTRPKDDSIALADRIMHAGHTVSIAPMIEVHYNSTIKEELTEALKRKPQAILITSANGIRALANLSHRRDIPLLVIGEASKAVAEKCGFHKVTYSEDSSHNLAAMVNYARTHLKSDDSHLLYISGSVVAADLPSRLAEYDLQCETLVLYNTEYVSRFPNDILHALTQQQINVVLLYSKRTAETFLQCLEHDNLTQHLSHMHAICLSDAIAETIHHLSWKSVQSVPFPVSAMVIDVINKLHHD